MIAGLEENRAYRLITNQVNKLKLNFSGRTVLTEAGSHHFIYTPFIAALADAAHVFVWIKDSHYASAEKVKQRFLHICDHFHISQSVFTLAVNDRPFEHIREADIVTNLGNIRPIDAEFIRQMKKSAVVSYMCEAWEIRPRDVDISACRENGIPVAGVWENHPDLLIFNGCGNLSVKLCQEAGFEVYQNNILVVSSDKFGSIAADTFETFGAKKVRTIKPKELLIEDLRPYDFIFIADYCEPEMIAGTNLESKIDELSQLGVIHLCGEVDFDYLSSKQIYCFPAQQGYAFRMTRTLAHLGMKPVIDLHAAGLKVGESLLDNQINEIVQLI